MVRGAIFWRMERSLDGWTAEGSSRRGALKGRLPAAKPLREEKLKSIRGDI
jgi:hypothetical protein